MTSKNVKISHTGPFTAKVEVDGRDLANLISAYHLTANVEDGPILVLQFSPAVLPEFDGPAEVQVTEDLHEALTFLGWVPPTDAEVTEYEVSTLGAPHRLFLRSNGTYRSEPWHEPDLNLNHAGSDRWTGGDRKDEDVGPGVDVYAEPVMPNPLSGNWTSE
jgi:hypothetical protein